MTTDLRGLSVKLDRLARDLTDRRLLESVGMEGKKIGTAAVRGDTGGDARMSNWRRGRPINLASRYDVVSETAVQIAPGARARGPVRVLTSGRRAGVSRRGRRYGASQGKGTWDRASDEMATQLPKVAQRHTSTVIRKHFG